MNIRAALLKATQILSKSETASLDSRILLSHLMAQTQEKLLLNYDQELDHITESKFFNLVDRRKKMEPIAYITGKKEFYDLEFVVNSSVLIPRPDTELIIDFIIGDQQENRPLQDHKIDILELGTGSGAISVSIANQVKTYDITATDISDGALNVAKLNAKIHNVVNQIEFVQSNWYENLPIKQYDYIISNPPYISHNEKKYIAQETFIFEPDLALYAHNDGLGAYENIISGASDYLKNNGKLVLEIGFSQKDLVSNLLREHQFEILSYKTDLSGLDRTIIAKKL